MIPKSQDQFFLSQEAAERKWKPTETMFRCNNLKCKAWTEHEERIHCFRCDENFCSEDCKESHVCG